MREILALGGEGILHPTDLEDFYAAEARVARLLSDGRWHNAGEIRLAAGKDGHPASEGLRRLRAVRAKLEERGYGFERERAGDGRNFIYRMSRTRPSAINEFEQPDLWR
jgi:hypothetical protein